jgi:hypothetical protein
MVHFKKMGGWRGYLGGIDSWRDMRSEGEIERVIKFEKEGSFLMNKEQ